MNIIFVSKGKKYWNIFYNFLSTWDHINDIWKKWRVWEPNNQFSDPHLGTWWYNVEKGWLFFIPNIGLISVDPSSGPYLSTRPKVYSRQRRTPSATPAMQMKSHPRYLMGTSRMRFLQLCWGRWELYLCSYSFIQVNYLPFCRHK